MVQVSFPYTGDTTGDDGPYSAEFFATFLEAIFYQQTTAFDNSGILAGTGNGTDDVLEVKQTSPATNSVDITEGKALIKGYYYFNNADVNITVAANNDASGFDRIDTIVLENDFINNTVRLDIVEGTPASTPVEPTLTQNSTIYQIPIANIDVANLFSTIVTADITQRQQQAIIRPPVQGGTGIDSYTGADMLYASNSTTLNTINLADTAHVLVGSGGSNPVAIDRRIIEAQASYSASNSYSWTFSGFTSLLDPTGYGTLDGSNRLELDEGTYLFLGAYQMGSVIASTNTGHGIRLIKNSSTTLSSQLVQGGNLVSGAEAIVSISLLPRLFSMSASDNVEAQFSTNGTWQLSNFQDQRFLFMRVF